MRGLLSMAECIDAVRGALIDPAGGGGIQPLQPVMWLPERIGALGVMPGYPPSIGVRGTDFAVGRDERRIDQSCVDYAADRFLTPLSASRVVPLVSLERSPNFAASWAYSTSPRYARRRSSFASSESAVPESTIWPVWST